MWASVRCASVAITRRAVLAGRGLGPGDQRLAGGALSDADAARIGPCAREGRAVGGRRSFHAGAAAGGQRTPAPALGQRLAPGEPALIAPGPATTLSLVAWRATHRTAVVPAAASPAITATYLGVVAASGSAA